MEHQFPFLVSNKGQGPESPLKFLPANSFSPKKNKGKPANPGTGSYPPFAIAIAGW